MKNLYTENDQENLSIREEFYKEFKEYRRDALNQTEPFKLFEFQLTALISHLKKSWYYILESTGGEAKANENSDNHNERMLFHIEKSIEEAELRLNKSRSFNLFEKK